MIPVRARSRRAALRGGLSLLCGSMLTLAACSSSSHSTSSAPPPTPGGPTSTSGPTTAPGGATVNVTVAAADLPGYGKVLVDGSGRSLYILSTQRYGQLTCTDASGCTRYWPATELPADVRSAQAGSGIDPTLLGTVKDPAGKVYVTYGGWPVYRYVGDKSPGQASGEGINSFGGSWYLLNVSGQPVTSKTQAGTPATTQAPYRGGGY